MHGMTTMTRPEAPVPDTLEHLRHIRVLESQVEGNKEIVAALRDLRDDLAARIDDIADETTGLVENVLTGIEALREAIQRLESKIDALHSGASPQADPAHTGRPNRIS